MLDLFAGSGALGLEALSRGARFCLFIEESAEARAAIRRNVETLGLTGVTKIWRRDATKLGEAGRLEKFDLILCDPPYGQGLGEPALAEAVDGGWADDGAIAVLEERADADMAWPDGCEEIDRRRYGDTEIAIARAGQLKAFSPLTRKPKALCSKRPHAPSGPANDPESFARRPVAGGDAIASGWIGSPSSRACGRATPITTPRASSPIAP